MYWRSSGFDFIFVETVGVESETVVSVTDCFLFLAMPGTGDELQGIKKGIMEMADIIALNNVMDLEKAGKSKCSRASKCTPLGFAS